MARRTKWLTLSLACILSQGACCDEPCYGRFPRLRLKIVIGVKVVNDLAWVGTMKWVDRLIPDQPRPK